jgi:hypothetical protein
LNQISKSPAKFFFLFWPRVERNWAMVELKGRLLVEAGCATVDRNWARTNQAETSGALARAGELDGRWASSKDKESRPSGEERGDGAGRLREFRSQKVWSKTKGFLILV